MDDEPRTLIFFSLNLSHEILHIVSYWVNLSWPESFNQKNSYQRPHLALQLIFKNKKECCNKTCEPLHCESFFFFFFQVPNPRWSGIFLPTIFMFLYYRHSRFRYQIPCTCFPAFLLSVSLGPFMQMQAFEFLPCTLCYNCSYLPGRILTPTKPGVNKNSIANRSYPTSYLYASRIHPRKFNRLFPRYDQRPRLAPCIE